MTTDLQRLKPDVTKFVIPAGEDPEQYPEQVFHVERFCFIKSLLMLEMLGELAEKVDVASLFTNGTDLRLDLLIEKLPVLMLKMRPMLTRALALTLVKNAELERLDREGLPIESATTELELIVRYRLDLDLATDLLALAIERIGVQNLKRNFPTLLAAIKAG